MSLFNWFSGNNSSARKSVPATLTPDSDSSGLTRDDRTRPTAGVREKDSSPAKIAPQITEKSDNKSHRHAKREQLYAAVRESMIRAGVLSGSYKFKVLSLDPRGDQFMVMMDLSQEFIAQAERLGEIEVLIAQGAKSRYNIRVTAVYWRINDMVTVSRPKPGQVHQASPPLPKQETPQPVAMASARQPIAAAETAVAATLIAAPVAAQRFEPLQADEVSAFKQALAAASEQGTRISDRAAGSRSYTLLTGFEDTEIPESRAATPALSATQYGDLI